MDSSVEFLAARVLAAGIVQMRAADLSRQLDEWYRRVNDVTIISILENYGIDEVSHELWMRLSDFVSAKERSQVIVEKILQFCEINQFKLNSALNFQHLYTVENEDFLFRLFMKLQRDRIESYEGFIALAKSGGCSRLERRLIGLSLT